jgi:glycosyltransferase involved in cell wall biosynthesis
MNPKTKRPERIALVVSFSGLGGVERMMVNLGTGLVEAGWPVDLLLVKAQGGHAGAIPSQVRVVELGARHSLSSVPALVRYLKRERPAVLLAAKDRMIKAAVVARWLAGVSTPVVGRLGTTVSAALEGRGGLKRRLWYQGMRLFYPQTDAIVAVSQGVADDIRHITGLPDTHVRVVPNPVWTPELMRLAREAADHLWLTGPDRASVPVILGVGRLTRQKDFPTLIRAFARLRQQRACRLIILGEGQQRPYLLALAGQLGVLQHLALPGFTANPYAYLSRSRLFVLSSLWEGSPNALTEALALGVPVVSTDCPSGPREILQGGRYGRLVPMGDVESLAQAMAETLENPLPAAMLQQAAQPYRVDASVRGYLDVMGFNLSGSGASARQADLASL